MAQERLGHSDIGVTLDTYSHVMPALGRDAAKRLDDSLDGGRETGGEEHDEGAVGRTEG